MNEESKDFKEGQQMFLDGVSWKDPKMVTAAHHRGWTEAEKRTRCGYSLQSWNKTGGYKTSSDLRTLFT